MIQTYFFRRENQTTNKFTSVSVCSKDTTSYGLGFLHDRKNILFFTISVLKTFSERLFWREITMAWASSWKLSLFICLLGLCLWCGTEFSNMELFKCSNIQDNSLS